jgi:hypothetical protein
MKNFIFIDIDGVLLTFPDAEKNSYSHSKAFTQSCVNVLNKITDTTGAKLVVSSAWRIEKSIEYIQKLFKDNGVTGEVAGKTDDPDDGTISISKSRGEYIQKWINENNVDDGTISISKSRGEYIQKWINENNVDRYVIIDDSEWDLKETHPNNFYHITNGDVGLQDSDIEPIKKVVIIVVKGKFAHVEEKTHHGRYYHLPKLDLSDPTKEEITLSNGEFNYPQSEEPNKIDDIIEQTKKIKDFDPLS